MRTEKVEQDHDMMQEGQEIENVEQEHDTMPEPEEGQNED